MKKMLILILSVIVGFFAVLLIYVYLNQKQMVFMPSKTYAVTPTELGLVFEDVTLTAQNGEQVHAWFIKSKVEQPEKKTVLFCHGNAGNISHRLETVMLLNSLGVDVLLFDYRGYGKSEGEPTELGTYEDARLFYNWLLSEKSVEPENLIIFGRSLGGAIAVDVASTEKCGGLIVESSFSSALGMGKDMFPYLPVKWLMRFQYDSVEKIKDMKCRVLITHSPTDEMIPFKMGQELYKNAPDPKKMFELTGGHNNSDYYQDTEYIKALKWLIYPQKLDSSDFK